MTKLLFSWDETQPRSLMNELRFARGSDAESSQTSANLEDEETRRVHRNVCDCCRQLCGSNDSSSNAGESSHGNYNAQAQQERPCSGQRSELLLRHLRHRRAAVTASRWNVPHRD